ncbi:conserved hypothetical protein [delta proteobacterium NaphS2]|nr:conserved hypothetical protein [delta proteobacterium NaphS2]
MNPMMAETGTIEKLKREIPQEEFEYQTLLDCLKGYARPRDKISDLLRKGIIIRVKKGLYVLGDEYRQRPFSREILGNLVYGPSYISLDYALHYYGLIPERVDAITSVTTGRSRKFFTPVGLFTYRMISLDAFRIGMDRIEIGEGRAFLMATPEKAMADKLQEIRGVGIKTIRDLEDYLEKDLRIDGTVFRELKPENLDKFARAYRSKRIRLLAETLRGIQTPQRTGS